jgi:Type I phosphodiesterase / nucleotide pyrophosphatase
VPGSSHAIPSSFADLPSIVERRVAAGERVLVVLLDAFGMRFVERHGAHPLLRRLDSVTEVASQFPSTTTAHVTTMHTGLPVREHGLYEWNVLEPALGRVITPLRFSFAGDREGDTLAATGFEPSALVPPEPTLYERLAARDVPSAVFQPDAFSPSTFDGAAARGAELRPYATFSAGVADALSWLPGRTAYTYVYLDVIDTTGHLRGPSSSAFDDACVAALDALDAALRDARDVTVLLTADHGQVEVDPERTLWLDELHPPLADLELRPAGSARDVFLHVPEADVDTTIAALAPYVEVRRVADLVAEHAFGGPPGPRLQARLATVCVLPPPGRMAWLHGAVDVQQRFVGHHGGRTREECRTWIGELKC